MIVKNARRGSELNLDVKFPMSNPAIVPRPQKRFFSVVIPLYNKEESIRGTLNSVLAQTHDAFEVVVVDDGSSDASASIVATFHDVRIRLIPQTNKGVSEARNAGVRSARFDYICFLDADDLWLPDFLETINRLIELAPEAGLFATAYKREERGGKVVSLRLEPSIAAMQPGRIRHYFRAATFGEQPFMSSAVCISRNAFECVKGFEPSAKFGEDLDIWGRLALCSELIFTPEPKAVYRMAAENRAMNGTAPLIPWVFRAHARNVLASRVLASEDTRDLIEHMARVDLYTVRQNLLNSDRQAVLSFLRKIETQAFVDRKCFIAIFMHLPLWLRKVIISAKLKVWLFSFYPRWRV